MGASQSAGIELSASCNVSIVTNYSTDPYTSEHLFTDWCCKDETDTLILPLYFEAYYASRGVRATIYILILLWLFVGVAIIADIFMCAIEEITSQTKTVRVAKAVNRTPDSSKPSKSKDVEYDKIEVRIWNDTVANLTLMALGSSAPEILLSVVEIVVNGFEAGSLGPGTIVGSAAFNLLIIIALCVSAIPNGETRRIERYTVFGTTSFFSLFAYAWVYFIVGNSAADQDPRIEIWEAVLTLTFFPILVSIAYMADKDIFEKCLRRTRGRDMVRMKKHMDGMDRAKIALPVNDFGDTESQRSKASKAKENNTIPTLVEDESSDDDDAYENFDEVARALPQTVEDQDRMISQLVGEMREANKPLDADEMAKLFAFKLASKVKRSRAWYRVNATREMTGGNKVGTTNEVMRKGLTLPKTDDDAVSLPGSGSALFKPGDIEIEFAQVEYSILEGDGKVDLEIRRKGDLDTECTIRCETIEGTATSNDDYVAMDDMLTFEPGEWRKTVTIEVIDDDEWEPDETFFVRISLPENNTKINGELCRIGKKKIAQVTILNDDEPGSFSFGEPSFLVRESCGTAQIPIKREAGCDGACSVEWKTIEMTAKTGRDFSPADGILQYNHGQQAATIELQINNTHSTQKDLCFQIEITKVTAPGAKIGQNARTVVTIVDDEEFSSLVKRVIAKTHIHLSKFRIGQSSWVESIAESLNVNGGDTENASWVDYVMHCATFPFKVVFTSVPPASMHGGYPCFLGALAWITVFTFFINEFATVLGCLLGISKMITAITIVALGTSVPDLFASKTAAINEETADDSIGNVTGSNSVNVFLGIGLPWTMAALYQASKGKQFRLRKETIEGFPFSVIIYGCCGMMCITLLIIRRYSKFFGRAELGGTVKGKYLTSSIMVALWILYVGLNILRQYKVINWQ